MAGPSTPQVVTSNHESAMSPVDQLQSDVEESQLSDDYLDRFGGIGRSYGRAALSTLSNAHVCVVGIGGVGTWVVEGLARSGVGELTLIDLDEICITNVNRQLHALTSTIGQPKVEAMAVRAREINPHLVVHSEQSFFTDKSEERLLGSKDVEAPKFDLLIDAIDDTKRKVQLIEACVERGIPVVTCGAAGGRRSPHLVTTADLKMSSHDGLLRRVKQLLKKSDRFTRKERDEWGIAAIFSTERPYYPSPDGGVCHTPPTREALRLGCDVGFGSLSFVTATFGFVAVSVGIDSLLSTRERSAL